MQNQQQKKRDRYIHEETDERISKAFPDSMESLPITTPTTTPRCTPATSPDRGATAATKSVLQPIKKSKKTKKEEIDIKLYAPT